MFAAACTSVSSKHALPIHNAIREHNINCQAHCAKSQRKHTEIDRLALWMRQLYSPRDMVLERRELKVMRLKAPEAVPHCHPRPK